MIKEQAVTVNDLRVESRLSRVEMSTINISDEIKDIKRNMRWLTGIVFSLNSTIIGLLAKGFNII
jgi:hypothetical protein